MLHPARAASIEHQAPARAPSIQHQAPSTSTEHSAPSTRHPVTEMFSLHIDTARTWRGGQNQVLLTVNGLNALGHRAALVAHPDGVLRTRASEGLELIPF